MKTKTEPLQTHGKYREVWNPPKQDRFARYEQSDESWLRPLGFGTVKKTLLGLFDVRLNPDGDLVGYINQNPAECSFRGLRFATIKDHDASFGLFTDEKNIATSPVVDMIELRVSRFAFNYNEYLAWEVNRRDVAALVRSGILTHGPDNKEQFLYELRYREEMRRLRR